MSAPGEIAALLGKHRAPGAAVPSALRSYEPFAQILEVSLLGDRYVTAMIGATTDQSEGARRHEYGGQEDS